MDPMTNIIAILVSIFLIMASGWRPLRSPRAPFAIRPPARTRRSAILSHWGPVARPPVATRKIPLAATPSAPVPRRMAASLPPLPEWSPTGLRREAPQARAAVRTRGGDYRRRPPWYRRKLVVSSMTVLLLLVTVLSAGAWYATSQLASLNDLSTPPPEISGEI